VPVDLQTSRDLMAGVCAPVTVVTTAKDDIPYGATVRAFASLALDPPPVTVALDRSCCWLRSSMGSTAARHPLIHTDKMYGTHAGSLSRPSTAICRKVRKKTECAWGGSNQAKFWLTTVSL
jgi:flavin reductase (DIM6/NTAB) family NADH-FMN oxidoreductase RutF